MITKKYIDQEEILRELKYRRDYCDPNFKRRAGYDSAIAKIERARCVGVVREVISQFQILLNEVASISVIGNVEYIIIPKIQYLAAIDRLKRAEAEENRRIEQMPQEAED